MDDADDTAALRLDQLRRARNERDEADVADEDAAEQTHDRRAERASYLAQKLAEREASEREAAGED